MELPFEDWSNTVHSFGDLASIIQIEFIRQCRTNLTIITHWEQNLLIMTSIQFVRQCSKISNFTRSDSLTSFLFVYTRTIERGWPSCPLLLWARVHQMHMVGSWTPPPDKHQPLFPCRHQQQPREDALISHLQNFILELGKGFYFESRQKRIIRFLLLPQKSCFGAKSHNQKSCFGAISHE